MTESVDRDEERAEGDEGLVPTAQIPITLGVVLSAWTAGAVGMALMTPLLVLVPGLLGVFRPEPIVDFAGFGMVFGLEPSLVLGIALFVVGGTIVLPLLFVVAGAFLPPREPRYLRGVTFATIFWVGFVMAFWPGGPPLIWGLFLVLSLGSHWVYGVALGAVLDRLMEIPEHDV